MAAVLRALDGEERSIALKPWLYRVAHNESIDLVRRRRPETDFDAASEVVAPRADAATRERLRELLADLGQLPEKQRAALVMRELNGLDYTEIGAVFGISVAAATQTVYDARRGLQELSEGRDLPCEDVQLLLSHNDGRLLKARKVRAHLRSCAVCRDFQAAMEQRTRDLAAISPVLPASVAASLLHGLFGGGGGGGATGGGLAGLSAGVKAAGSASVGLKSAAIATVVATAGTGAAVEFDALTSPSESQARKPAAAVQVASTTPASTGARPGPAAVPLVSVALPLQKLDRLHEPGPPASTACGELPTLSDQPVATIGPRPESVPGPTGGAGGAPQQLPAPAAEAAAPTTTTTTAPGPVPAPAPEEPARGNGRGNGNGQGNGNGNANGRGNGNANGQANGNGNANGQGNGNATGQANGNGRGNSGKKPDDAPQPGA